MTRKRQHGGASGAQKAAQSMWERAGAQAGDGAGALFARLDAQDAQDTHGPQDTRDGQTPPTARASAPGHPRERAAHSLERLAELIRAGVWSAELAALVAATDDLLERRERGAR
ncbi:MAG: hypothetical protein KGO05_07070 [Chloroflexota bacterium]|nr:hypothetical protein [Chloroflexota bacterium]